VPQPSDRIVLSPDGTRLAVFGTSPGRPILLVHGTAADHTTFRVIGPRLETTFGVRSMDRRGRGASGDTPPYSIEREFEDVAAVAEALAAEAGAPIAVVGHSYGGRCALGAALLTESIERVVCYEGAPTPRGASYRPTGLEDRLRERDVAGDLAGILETFMSEVVGMSTEDLDAYRSNPVWPQRVAAAPTILRELGGEASDAASLVRLSEVRQPVLQLLGTASKAVFRDATYALDARLRSSKVVEIEGARHAAHHTHPDAVVAAICAFVASDGPAGVGD
jgi:pimeloyl-ACP methyl ester carboxylesterase